MTDGQRNALGQLFKYNAERCEHATSSVCVCRCGGALHGREHSAAWIEAQVQIAETVAALRDMAEQGKLVAMQRDLFE